MAEDRIAEIVVPLRYEYNNKDLRKMSDDINKIGNGKGFADTKKGFRALTSEFAKMSNSFSLESKNVVSSYNKVVNAIKQTKSAEAMYKGASAKVSTAKSALNAARGDGNAAAIDSATKKYRAALLARKQALSKYQGAADVVKVSIQNLLAEEDAYRQNKIQEEIQKRKAAWETLGNTLKKVPQKFKQGIQSFAATLYVLRRITNFIKQLGNEITNLISASSKWIENLNLLEVVFGDVSENAQTTKEWVEKLSRQFSMDKNALVQYVSTFKQMANAMGQASEIGEKMSEVLTQLGLDIASLRNVKTETAMSDLASAIAGQIKPVRKYGFDITQQSIAALLKETGIGGSTASLSQADKQLARTILLIRQSRDAWGDLGKTINTFANQERILNDQFETTKRLIGQVFLGTFQFGQKLEDAQKTAGVATQIIWHLNSVVIAFNDVLEAILPTADTVNGAIAALAEDTQDELEETNEAIEGSLATFDKFNVMQSASSNGAGGTGATLEGVFSKEATKYLQEFEERAENIRSYARDLADDLLRKLFPEFDKWAGNSKKTFKEWYESADGAKSSVQAMIAPITNLANTVKEIIISGINDIPNILAATSNLLTAIANILQPIVKAVADILAKLGADGVAKLIEAIFWTIVSIKAIGLIGSTIVGLGNIIKSLKIILPMAKTGLTQIGIHLNSTLTTTQMLSVTLMGMTAMVGGIIAYSTAFKDMSKSAKIVVPVVSVLLGLLVAVVGTLAAIRAGGDIFSGILKTAAFAAAITGISLTVGSAIAANAHAQGGYQTGGLFYAGESGAEWVGRQGNTSTIVNDKQMSDIMQQSVAMGVVQGNRMASGASGKGTNKVAVVNLDGKRLFEVVQENGKRVGKVFAEA